MVELVDTPDLKSGVLRDVWVQIPLEVQHEMKKKIYKIDDNFTPTFDDVVGDTFGVMKECSFVLHTSRREYERINKLIAYDFIKKIK